MTEGVDHLHSLADTKKQIAVEISSPPTPRSYLDPLSAESQRNHALHYQPHLLTATAEFTKDEFGNDCYKVKGGSKDQGSQFQS